MTAETLAQWIKQSNRTVVLTGAGMSTESGIPDFRSSTGIWQKSIRALSLQQKV